MSARRSRPTLLGTLASLSFAGRTLAGALAMSALVGCYGVDAADRAALNADAGAGGPGVVGQPSATGTAMDAGPNGGNRVFGDAGVPTGTSGDGGAAGGDAAAPGGDAGGYVDPDSGVFVYPLLPNMSCRAPYTDSMRNHDIGYDGSDVHGLDAVLASSDCRSCHGDKLEGCARAPSCNNCHDSGHQPGWQTNCVYCHGSGDNDTGAPPRFLDGNDQDRPSKTFLVHTEHVTEGDHPAYDCVQCHVKPVDVLSKGHMFDLDTETPGVAEVVFAGGLSKSGSFAAGTCSNLYCHGDGRSNGSVDHTKTGLACTSCHADRTQASQLSGSHAVHLATTEGGPVSCAECHADVISTGDSVITGKTRHVDGKKDVRMPSGVTMDNTKTCTGACHGFTHGGLFFPTRTW